MNGFKNTINIDLSTGTIDDILSPMEDNQEMPQAETADEGKDTRGAP